MSTLAQMRSRIADDLNRSDLNTQIDKAINRAIIHYEKQHFWFNENTWGFTTTPSTEPYTFSAISVTDLKEIDLITLKRNSSDIYPLTRIGFSELREKNQSGISTTGASTEYAMYANTFYLYPIPDATYSVTVYGTKAYTALSSDGDSNDFTTTAEDLIEARARWWLYKRVLKDAQMAADAKSEELEALNALDTKTSNLIAKGRITPWL